jgi:hypothetical protein
MRIFVLVGAACAAAGLLGCVSDGYSELGLVDVSGVVKLDGQPLSGAQVAFEDEEKRVSTGVTDASGRYALMYDSQTPGTPPGKKIVRITTAATDAEGGGAAEGAATAKEIIPSRYNSKSELKADVSASNRTFDFDLQSKP